MPYVLGAEDPAVIYLSMLSGSVAGSAAALYMTRDMTEGRSIGNLAFGAAIEAGPSGVRPGIPLPVPVASSGGERIGLFVPVARLSY